jgi:hypothetical protein
VIYTKQNCFHVSSENSLNDGSKKLIPGHNRMILYIYKKICLHRRGCIQSINSMKRSLEGTVVARHHKLADPWPPTNLTVNTRVPTDDQKSKKGEF